MKALILAAGRGKRLGEITQEKNKCLFEIAGRPLIAYSLDCASKIPQVSEIVIVVGYQAEEIINFFGDHYQGKPVKYVFQKEQKGLVNAIESAEAALGKEDFLLMLGDELMTNPRHLEMIRALEDKDIFSLCGVLLVENRESLIKKARSQNIFLGKWYDLPGRLVEPIKKVMENSRHGMQVFTSLHMNH